MRRSLSILCALLVVAAALPVSTPLVGAADADDPDTRPTAQVQPIPGQNTTSVLLLTGETTSGYAQSTMDLAPAVTATHGAVGIQIRERIVRERLRDTSTVDRRRQVLRQETERLAREVESLEQVERRALARYERGEISVEELLRTLAAVDAEARQAEQLVALLQDEVSQVQFLSSTEDRLQSLQVKLAMLRGPVREHARAVFRGEADSTRIHVSVSGEAVALAAIRGNTYVREVNVPANIDTAATDRFSSESEVIARIGTLYPWAWTSDTSSVRTYTNFENGFYRINVDHTHGRLTSYLDGSTQDVFSEVQYKSLSRTPAGQPTTAEANGTTLRVNQSFAGGPVQVTARETESERPVTGTVYLDGERVGRTGGGQLWLVGPAAQYEVTLETDAGNVTVTGQPVSQS
ncbi:hypothetical protein [Salinigranum sp.]|uniref:DUF7096 domain-containing protein n=1 Tax=Salinigranum sp. TaxID=1966351 RepID=UPI003566B508